MSYPESTKAQATLAPGERLPLGGRDSLSPGAEAAVRALALKYPDPLAATLPALYVAQEDMGFTSLAAMKEVARVLMIPDGHVFGVATFYTMFQKKPVGRYHLQVCTNLCCALRGGAQLFERLCERLGLHPGESSPDGLWSVEEVECLGSCGSGPCLQVNQETFDEFVDEARLDQIIEACRRGDVPEWGEVMAIRTKSDPQCYTFEGFGSDRYPNLMLRGAGEMDNWQLRTYEAKHEGYVALRKALKMEPTAISAEVKASGLRGRGGAGFPTGLKWTFMPKDTPEKAFTRYVVCNADEGEPGTFKDRAIMEYNPHQLIEGLVIAGWAMGCKLGFIYVRGEFKWLVDKLDAAIQQAREAGYLGRDILGSGFDFDILTYRGAGAYICGEETALLNSLEGRRGEPRVKPPFPAVKGAFGQPTTVNNVETLAAVPPILRMGGGEYAKLGTANNTGTRIFGLSGHVKRPGLYELPLGLPLDFILNDLGGGSSTGRKIKAVIPGGASAPMWDASAFDCPMDFDTVKARGSMAGSGGIIAMDEATCMVQATLRLLRFYAHESCGQCTPCREGCNWITRILARIEGGQGRVEDLPLLESLVPRISMRTLCPLGDAACGPLESALRLFRPEFEYHIEHKGCPATGVPLLASLGTH